MHRRLSAFAALALWAGAALAQTPFGSPVDIIGRPQPQASPPSPAPAPKPPPRPLPAQLSPASHIASEVARVFDEVQLLSVIAVDPEDRAARTLEGLTQIDPAFDLRRVEHGISVLYQGAVVARAAAVRPSAWPSALEQAIDAALAASPTARAAAPLDIAAALVNAMETPFGNRVRHLVPSELRPLRPLPSDAAFGAMWERRGDRLVIRAVAPDGPAARVKLEPGDAILEIDDAPVPDLSDAAVAELLTRPISRRMTMQIARVNPKEGSRIAVYGGARPFDVAVGDGVLIIRFQSFARDPSAMMVTAAEALRAAPVRPVGIVLDLRGNAGGTLDASVALASLFLDPGPVATVVGGKDTPVQRFPAKIPRGADRALQELPLVVLVNGETASGAEIAAGALQLRGRAVVAGTATRAVGEIDTIIPLRDQLGAVRFTTGMVFLPGSYPLQGFGIAPTVCLAGAAGDVGETIAAGLRAMAPFGGRSRAQLAREERAAARNACPGSPREPASDLVVAGHLARSAGDYRRALDSVPANPRTSDD